MLLDHIQNEILIYNRPIINSHIFKIKATFQFCEEPVSLLFYDIYIYTTMNCLNVSTIALLYSG